MTYNWRERETIPVWAIVSLLAGIEPDEFNDIDDKTHVEAAAKYWPIVESAIDAGKLKVCKQTDELRGWDIDIDSYAAWVAKRNPRLPESTGTAYSTPYMDVMRRAIEHFAISPTHQGPKASVIQEWALAELEKIADGTKNKAKMVTTFIRMPEAQRGGNKRS